MKSNRIISIVVFGLIVVITPLIFALKKQDNVPVIKQKKTAITPLLNQEDWSAFEAIENGVKEVFIGKSDSLHALSENNFGTQLIK